MKRIALSVPSLNRLYREYLQLAEEKRALDERVERLTEEVEDALSAGPAAASVNLALERERDQAQRLLAGLQHTANCLTTENEKIKELNAILTAERDQLSTQVSAQDAMRSLHEQVTARLTHFESELTRLGTSTNTSMLSIQSMQEAQGQMMRNSLARMAASLTGDAPKESPGFADAWLDLMEKVLTGALQQDEPFSPWSNGSYDPAVRSLGRDWPAHAFTMIGTARMRNIRALCERALLQCVDGDFLEAGVWRGGACIYMRAILAAHRDASRRVFVADSFTGLPPPDEERYPADLGDRHHEVAELAVGRQQVEDNFDRFGLLDEQVVFLEGWFKDTLPTAPIDKLAVLRLDGDMYESTIQTLEALYDKVSPGGFVIIDDYVLGPCAQAVDEFRTDRRISEPLQQVDGAAVWWQVPA